jgi:hypothetical protein
MVIPVYLRDSGRAAKTLHGTKMRHETLTVRPRSATVMREPLRTTMKAIAIASVTVMLAFGFAGPAHTQALDGEPGFRVAQVQKKKKAARRAPTRITVRPALRYRLDATPYPRTDNLGYPGRNAVRQCVSWLRTEHRPSGTVVTPQMRCWWDRG